MMGRALLVVGGVATLGFIATGVMGHLLSGHHDLVSTHILVALVSALLLLFSHCWIMFFLIGTGKAIRDAVKENGLETAMVDATKRFKAETFGWATLAMGLAMATFILGGGAYTGAVPIWIHGALFYATVVVQGWTMVREGRVLARNDRLMVDINRRLGA